MTPVIGIDPTAGCKPAGFAVLDEEGALLELKPLPMSSLVERCAAWPGAPIGIDCPLSLPRGLHCLDPDHDCPDIATNGKKTAEAAILALGIGLYVTSKRSIIRGMIQACIALKQRLERQGHEVFEVYPHAAKVLLFGRPVPSKASAGGLLWLRDRLTAVCGIAPLPDGLRHDELDAALVAHVVWRYKHGGASAVGDPDEGTILIPVCGANTDPRLTGHPRGV